MEAGGLDQRIELQRKVVTTDTLNAEIVTWAPVCNRWAKVGPIAGRYAHLAQQMQAPTGIQIEVRKDPQPVSELWRAIWAGRVLSIFNVLPNPELDGWILLCAEGKRDA